MAYLPREVFNHYIHGPYMHPVCQEFLENTGCKGDCMLAHPAKRVRIFHPRFLYEAFPAGLVICCKNFVLYGDCACQHMDPTARREINLDMFFHPPLHIRNYLRKKILGPDAKDATPPPPESKDSESIAKEEEDLIRLLEELKCSEESRSVKSVTVGTQTTQMEESPGSPGIQQRRHTTPSRLRHSFPPPAPELDTSGPAAVGLGGALSPRPLRSNSRRLSVPSPTSVGTGAGLLSEQRRRFWLLTQQLHLIAAMTGKSLSPDPAVLAACPPLDDQAIKTALNLPATAELPPIFHFLRMRAQQQPAQQQQQQQQATLTTPPRDSGAAGGTDALAQLLSASPFPFGMPGSGLGYC